MAAHQLQTRPEPTTVAGEILIGQNHIALLHGLYDRPGGTATSQAGWVRASMPHAARFQQHPSKACLRRATRTIHPCWVTRVRRGRCIEVALTQRGRAIVEGQLQTRIRGWGTYEGMRRIIWKDQSAEILAAQVPRLSPESVREAVAYATAHGIPLLKHGGAEKEKDLTLFAVTTGLGRSFSLKSREELEMRGPRYWHAGWTRAAVERNHIPEGYRELFSDYDSEDVICYLSEQQSANSDRNVYCHTYAGRQFLSDHKFREWMSEEIDLLQTDINPSDLVGVIRASSETHCRVAKAVADFAVLSWTHPDTGKCIGRVLTRDIDSHEAHDLVATTCAALGCFQSHCDLIGLGIQIETRYVATKS